MILDGVMVSAKLVRWREIEQTFRECEQCKKTYFSHDWIDVTPCTEHKPLAKELQQLAEKR
jgi:hypothetical protein